LIADELLDHRYEGRRSWHELPPLALRIAHFGMDVHGERISHLPTHHDPANEFPDDAWDDVAECAEARPPTVR
jgi:hypothetical protein